jgi:hypothetical protein
MAAMKAALAVLLLASAARAMQSAGGGAGTVSVAAGDLIYTAVPIPGGVNGQLLVRRLAADGGVFWEQRWGRARGEEPTSIAVAPDGGVVVAGAISGACFVVRFDATGRELWDAAPSAGGPCRPAGVVVDGEGNSYLLATVTGSAGYDALVWRLGTRGDAAWSYRYSQSSACYAQNLYLDPRGDRLRAFVLRKDGTEFREEFFRLDLSGRRL